MNLLIDIGNTRIKWAITQAGELILGQALVNHQLDRADLVESWKRLTPPRNIGLACVSGNHLANLVQSVAGELWPGADVVRVKSQASGFDVRNAYRQAETLGVDRWLALIAVRHYYQLPACIVDCGTAITVDLIDADGIHQGGLICPGLALMKKSLTQNTAALQLDKAHYTPGLADFTGAAIHSGTLYAACGLIEHVLTSQAKPPQLIITGGDAAVVAPELNIQSVIDTALVFRGLSLVLENKP